MTAIDVSKTGDEDITVTQENTQSVPASNPPITSNVILPTTTIINTAVSSSRGTTAPHSATSVASENLKNSKESKDSSHSKGGSGLETPVAPMDTSNNKPEVIDDGSVSAPSDWSPTAVATPPTARKKGWPRGRKRRCLPKDAPKAPLSGLFS